MLRFYVDRVYWRWVRLCTAAQRGRLVLVTRGTDSV